MRRTAPLFALVLLSFVAPSSHAAALGSSPDRTWVVVIGVLDFRDRESFEPFPKANRRDARLVAYFRNRGVPTEQIVYLRDAGATASAAMRALARVAAEARSGDTLFVYYTGHGWTDDESREVYFATYDAVGSTKGIRARSVVSFIDRSFRGSRAFLFADCCNSGALADAVRRTPSRVGFACLTSSQAAEESTGNWTFTDCLLAALAGSPHVDLDADGVVTIGELAVSAADEMALGEEQLISFVATRGFPAATTLAAAGPKRSSRIGERGEVWINGDSYRVRITDVRGERIKVHIIGDDANEDLWLAASSVRPVRVTEYAVGTVVKVESEGEWYRARVLEARRGVHRVRYVGYSADEDEWVPSSRIRARRTAKP
jgi:hypothetical protein